MKPQKIIQDEAVVCVSLSVISDQFDHLKKTSSVANGQIDCRKNGGPIKDAQVPGDAINSREELCVESQPKLTFQVLGSIVIAMAHLGVACINGFSGVTLPQLTTKDSGDVHLSPSDAALFGSIVNIGAALGSILVGPFVLRYGQRFITLVNLPVCLLFWLLLTFSPSVTYIIVSRFFLGVSAGVISTSSNTYVIEVAHKANRGWLFNFIPMTRQFGFLVLSCIASTSLSWRHLSLICGLVTTLPAFIFLLFFPNSPRWLVTRGRISDAKKSLTFFRGANYDVSSELTDIINEVGEQQTANSCNFLEQLCMLGKKHIFKKFFIILFITVLSPFNGSFVTVAYLVPIFQSASTNVDGYTSAIIVSAVRVISTVFAAIIIDRFERKNLLVITYFWNAMSLTILGTYFYADSHNWNLTSLRWLPLFSLVSYTISLTVCIPIKSLLRGELLPSVVRPIGYSILVTVMNCGGFLATFLYPMMTETFGEYGSFWTYSAACLIIAIFSFFAVPLTSGRSLEEISQRKNRRLNTNGEVVHPD